MKSECARSVDSSRLAVAMCKLEILFSDVNISAGFSLTAS